MLLKEKLEKIKKNTIIKEVKKILKKLGKLGVITEEVIKKIEEIDHHRDIKFKIKIINNVAKLYAEINYEENFLVDFPLILILILEKEYVVEKEEEVTLITYINLNELKNIVELFLYLKNKKIKICDIEISKNIWEVLKNLNVLDINMYYLDIEDTIFYDNNVLYIYKDKIVFRIVLEEEIDLEKFKEILYILFT